MTDPGKSAAHKTRHKRLEIRRLISVDSGDPPSTASSADSSDCSIGDDSFDGGGLVYGHVSLMGRRRLMEDAVTVAPPVLGAEKYSFFAVYDGHGGDRVAERCRVKMHTYVEKHVRKEEKSPEEGGFDWKKVMAESFLSMEAEIEHECRRNEAATAAERMVGSTATVVLVGKEEVVVANCGDSRAVLCRDGVVVPLSTDHKPDRADEKERIEAAGGMIINWNGWRVEGVLSTSRSLGDRYLKPYVCSEPEVSVVRRSGSDEVLLIGTDGLFDVVCNEVACDVVKRCLSRQLRPKEAEGSRASEAAAKLAELAISKGSTDNISVIIVQMKSL
ncbi:hypothetical protein ACS0TY_011701 [Phlomoides rotata]